MEQAAVHRIHRTGASTLTIGIVVMVTGVAAGVLLIINGASMLREKYEII